METGRFIPDFEADKGKTGGMEKTNPELQKKQERLNDLNVVLSKVPEEARKNKGKYDEYKSSVDEAKKRLKEGGIDTDIYTKKDLQIGTEVGNKEYGQRKAELRAIVEKISKGEELNEEELKKTKEINVKKEDLFVEEPKKEEEPEIVKVEEIKKGSWVGELALIDRIANTKLQQEIRTKWVMDNLSNGTIPQNVLEEQVDKINQEIPAPAKENKTEENKSATVEKKNSKKAEEFNDEEMAMIIKECYDLVFEKGKNSSDDVRKALVEQSGIIAGSMGRGKDPVLSVEFYKKIEALGIDSWCNMRNVVGQWDKLKETKEIDTYSLDLKMFMYPVSEHFFAKSKCFLPFEDVNGKFVEVREVDLQSSISGAMKEIRHHFADELKDKYGNPALVEYWKLVGNQDERAKLYKELGLNKYIGEAAYTLLLSYQMLTDTSAEDFMSMMVDQADTRVKKYKISEERDAFVRMIIQEDLANDKLPFTRVPSEEFFQKRKETADRLAQLIPAKLIPTGLTGDGAARLEAGDWLRWRVEENYYSRNDLDNAKIKYNSALYSSEPVDETTLQELKDKIKPATDPGTRLDMMRSALTVLNLMKEIASDSSNLDTYESLKGRLYAHMTGSFGDARWLGDNAMVPAEFAFREDDGSKRSIPINEWISRTMMGVGKTFIYTHTVVDHKCTKPWDMSTFAANAEQLFRSEVQSTKGTFIGQEKEKWEDHRKDMLSFIDKMWNYSYEVLDAVTYHKKPAQYPKWYQSGVLTRDYVVKVAESANGSIGDWMRRKRVSKL